MFPTKGAKSRLPQTLAYPANAKLISEALADVPQSEELSISFYFSGDSASLLKEREWRILEASYYEQHINRFTPRYWEEARLLHDIWNISIYPVFRPIKHRIQHLLLLEGLPKVREWLIEGDRLLKESNPKLNKTSNYKSIKVFYNQEFERLEYK